MRQWIGAQALSVHSLWKGVPRAEREVPIPERPRQVSRPQPANAPSAKPPEPVTLAEPFGATTQFLSEPDTTASSLTLDKTDRVDDFVEAFSPMGGAVTSNWLVSTGMAAAAVGAVVLALAPSVALGFVNRLAASLQAMLS